MPYEIEKHPGGLTVRYHGFVGPQDFLQSQGQLETDPDGPQRRFLVCDFSDMDSDSIWALTPDITDVVGKRHLRVKRDRSAMEKVALVTTSEKIKEQCQRFIETYMVSPNASVRYFTTTASAWSWINTSSPK
jgi:hypothetical protein